MHEPIFSFAGEATLVATCHRHVSDFKGQVEVVILCLQRVTSRLALHDSTKINQTWPCLLNGERHPAAQSLRGAQAQHQPQQIHCTSFMCQKPGQKPLTLWHLQLRALPNQSSSGSTSCDRQFIDLCVTRVYPQVTYFMNFMKASPILKHTPSNYPCTSKRILNNEV